jgi:hypothetical protein
MITAQQIALRRHPSLTLFQDTAALRSNAYFCTVMKVPVGEDTPPTVAITWISPFAAESGTATLI